MKKKGNLLGAVHSFPENHKIVILSFVVYLLTVILNDGFIATDEYFTGITRYIPAQASSLYELVRPDDVKSPLQIMPMYFLAQIGLRLGIEQPYLQYRFVLAVLAFFHFLILGYVFYNYHRNRNFPKVGSDLSTTDGPSEFSMSSGKEGVTLGLIFSFYFMAPFSLTRPMFESLAAPWIALAVYFGSLYDEKEEKKHLLLSVLAISVAFVLRQQVGACALAILILAVLKKRWKDFLSAGILGISLFLISGVPDIFLRGEFHFSLKSILFYNIQHGSEYANHPIYTYPLLIFILCFGPWWLLRYPKGFWSSHWRRYRMEWLVLSLFVASHSCFPQKWERFIISMVPVMVILLVPLMVFLWDRRSKYRLRFWSLIGVNSLLWGVASFFPPQKNLIGLSLYLDRHPEVMRVVRVNEIPEWITTAFIRNPHFRFEDLSLSDFSRLASTEGDCSTILVVPAHLKKTLDLKGWDYDETMEVNAIEAMAYRLNPTTNVRRAELLIFRCKKK